MKLLMLVVLSCVASLVVCVQPGVHRSRRIRKHPIHLRHKQKESSHQNSESTHLHVQPHALPSHPEQESSTIRLESIEKNKEKSRPEEHSVDKKSEPVQKKKEKLQRSKLPYPETKFQRLPALSHEEIHDQYGQYALRYITVDNTVVSERGRLVPAPDGGYVLEIEGKYQFDGDDGQLYVTSFRGGPDGFYVDGKHLPVQVPMPAI